MAEADFSPTEELKDIQGGLIGFNKDHQQCHYINFGDVPSAKQLLAELIPQLANGFEVLNFNAAYGDNLRRGGDPEALQSTWVNLWLTRDGLAVLGPAGIDAMPEEVTAGMAMRQIGDVGASAPETWVDPFKSGAEPGPREGRSSALIEDGGSATPTRDTASDLMVHEEMCQ